MPKSEETPFDAYIQTVLAQLSPLTAEQRAVIQAELEAHLVDAAHERGSRLDDPAFQAVVIAELGPPRHLGKAWALAYPSSQDAMHGSQKIVFWGLWIVASIVGWTHGSYDDTSMWHFPAGGMVVIALQTLLLRQVAGARWWRQWLIASIVPWVVMIGVWMRVPWATIMEAEGKGTFIFSSSILLTGIALGVGQWLALRRHVNLAGLWIIVPLVSLVIAMTTSLRLNVALIRMSHVVVWLGGWQEAHILVGVVFGAIYGLLTGSSLLALMSLRRPHPSLQQA